MMYYTDDPIADFHRYDSDKQEQLNKLPKCVECKEPIQQTDAVYIDGGYICDGCLEDLRREVLCEW